jgi:hypothetical protein
LFDRLFVRSDALTRQLSAPLADERRQYLANCGEQGMSKSTLRSKARILLSAADHLKLAHRPQGQISIQEIERAQTTSKCLSECEIDASGAGQRVPPCLERRDAATEEARGPATHYDVTAFKVQATHKNAAGKPSETETTDVWSSLLPNIKRLVLPRSQTRLLADVNVHSVPCRGSTWNPLI